MRHTVEPVGDHLARQDGSSLADEDEKGGLKCVLGVVVVAKETAAYSPDHRCMSPHQRSQCGLLAVAQVALQQLPVRQARPVAQEDCFAECRYDLAHPA